MDDIVIQKGEFDWRSLFNDENALTKALEEFDDREDARAAIVAAREEVVMYGADVMELAELKMHDLSVQGEFLESTRLAPGWTDGRHDLKALLEELVKDP